MEYTFTYKNRTYTYNSKTEALRLHTSAGGTVPIAPFHPSVSGIKEFIDAQVVTR